MKKEMQNMSLVHRSNRMPMEAFKTITPVVLVSLSAGMIELVDVHTHESFKMPTTMRIGSANDLMKHCPFSHHRVVIDDENVAAEIFQAALKSCSFVQHDVPTIFVVRPQSSFVGDLAKSELHLLSKMVDRSGFTIADVQFFLKDKVTEEDWTYFEELQMRQSELVMPTHDSGTMSRIRRWFNQNL
ncbi:hypothetical protein [Kingella negevensis]|uniref:hypothetical protein n=1 Tax=Kingella negevensis TaxID=1522312 RepID=UPI00050A1564|nr:hypothetical protein [Kingella negevensis]MDK4687986.1 hypothetical protein [Kingella negevensis]WII91030.1 hypothetical protein QEO93_00035 [Kingella negevensis]WII93134.1 hypothetical protein QEO94_11035 [Kingella negevensis]